MGNIPAVVHHGPITRIQTVLMKPPEPHTAQGTYVIVTSQHIAAFD